MNRISEYLGLQRNIVVMLGVITIIGMGEELWSRFMPKYLEALGTGTWIVAVYGTLKDFLDAVYQYPGGWLADRLGRRRALILFTVLAMAGYAIYLFSLDAIWILLGTVLVMSWSSLSSPAIFAIIGDTLPQQRRSIGFGVQSILKRIPIVVAPSIGGLLVAAYGLVPGVRTGLVITLFLSAVAIIVANSWYVDKQSGSRDRSNFKNVWREMNPGLKQLLVADCFARWAEGIPEVFIVLYVINVLGSSPFQFGWLTSLQMFVSIVAYIPIARLADRLNRKPFILLTFVFFSLFPLALVYAHESALLVGAFVVGGLREIGEPARKALIVDLAAESMRGRSVGVYYLVRGLVVFPASILGWWLWTLNPEFPLYAAFAVGVVGCIYYAVRGSDPKVVSAER